MPHRDKKKKIITPPRDMVHFSWGGRTQEWEEEADQIMHILQDQIDNQETQEEIKKKIEYGKQKQYW
ncbi:hypothetical protein [Clostridium formicaceticum]|uniref:Uncharacterized protein n=1 Tax=Clostridium formicaceticum TaxID=1497 RepID=A0AAC9WGR3_9CLOT|nr:hypothetical protein [Clostridium formicaceticum]AOY77523.1 hypothetical protein BJL90_17685 [Clostridium formicaceticum]ARE88094.1 hypothetical protein CLFO_24950 [Clostridium formicaceticum]